MSFENMLNQQINDIIKSTYPEILDNLNFQEYDKEDDFDLTIKPGFLYSKQLGLKPEQIGSTLANQLQTLDEIENIQIISGYINIKLSQYALEQIIKDRFTPPTKHTSVIVDYASINPTGPMHAGHLRMCIIADVLCNILSINGFDVQREYYVNDTGGQAQKLVEAVYAQYSNSHITEQYPGEYIKDIANQIRNIDKDKWIKNDYYEYFRVFATQSLLEEIRKDLENLGIVHDRYVSEHQMLENGEIDEALMLLKQKGLVELVQLNEPVKYKTQDDKLISNDLTTALVIDQMSQPKALLKGDGSHTYLLADIALHLKRAKNANLTIDCFGADHLEHGMLLEKLIPMLDSSAKLRIKTCQMVGFQMSGQQFKMSKRAGTYITSADILKATSVDSIRVAMLSSTGNAHMVVDVNKIMQIDENSPLFYIQYAFARIHSLLSKSCDNTGNLNDIRRLLIKCILFESTIENVTRTLETHTFFNYTLELARAIHNCWNASIRLVHFKNVMEKVRDLLEICIRTLGLTPQKHMDSK